MSKKTSKEGLKDGQQDQVPPAQVKEKDPPVEQQDQGLKAAGAGGQVEELSG